MTLPTSAGMAALYTAVCPPVRLVLRGVRARNAALGVVEKRKAGRPALCVS